MTEPMVTTNNSKRVLSLSDQYRQVLNGKILDPSLLLTFVGNLENGWWLSGVDQSSSSVRSWVTRITYANGTESVRGYQVSAVRGSESAGGGSASNTSDLWATTQGSLIQRITYANDMVTSTLRGGIGLGGLSLLTMVANTTSFWSTTGENALSISANLTTKTEMAADTANGVLKQQVPSTNYASYVSSYGNPYDAWFVGGTTNVRRMTYATDTLVWAVRGNLAVGARRPIQTGNMTDMWFEANNNATAANSNVQRISYMTDTSTTSVRGNTPYIFYLGCASSNFTDSWYSNDFDTTVSVRYTFSNETFTSLGGRTTQISRSGSAK